MKPEIFNLEAPALRSRRAAKWSKYPTDVLPAWIADMDIGTAPAVRAALQSLAAKEAYTYPARGADLADAFARRMEGRFHWVVNPDDVVPVVDLVQATLASIVAFSAHGDGVIVQVPSYPGFLGAIGQANRRLIPNAMTNNLKSWSLDLDALEHACDKDTRLLIFCHPHNPTGRAHSPSELRAIAQFVVRHDLVVVSDEIFADLVYPPAIHIPLASIGPEIAARTITITSAGKSFNIAALRCAVMHFGSADLKDRFAARFPLRLLGVPGVTGVDATIAAWDHGQSWLDEVVSALESNSLWLINELNTILPDIRTSSPDAGFLVWLDCRALKLPVPAGDFFLDYAKVGLSAGETFGPDYTAFVRLNFATSRPILEEIIRRMTQAVRLLRTTA